MARNVEKTEPAAVDPRAFLRAVNAETLEAQIVEAKERAAAANGELKALLSLRRMVDIRDGKLVSPLKGRKRTRPAEPEQDGERPAAEDSALEAAEIQFVEDIEIFLARAIQPQMTQAICRNVGIPMGRLEAVLQAYPEKFRQVDPARWEIVDEE